MVDSDHRTGPVSEEAQELIDESRLMFNVGLCLSSVTRFSAVWLYLAAGALLALKVILSDSSLGGVPWILWIGGTGLPVLAAALIVALRRRYSRLDAAAWLDLHREGGGALIAVAEDPAVGSIEAALPGRGVRPALGLWRGARTLLLPLVLLGVVLFLPWRERPARLPSSLDSRAEVVERRVDLAKKLGLIPDGERRSFEQDLARAKGAAKRAPEAAAESIDTVDRRLDQAILKSAKLSREAIDTADRLLAEARAPSGSGLSGAAAELEKTLDDLIEREVYAEQIRRELRKLAEQRGMAGSPTAAEMADGLKPLESMDLEQLKSLARALRNGQILSLDQAGLAKGLLSGQEAREHLQLLIAGAGQGQGEGEGQGQGGVARGPGTAPLKLGEVTDTDKIRFKPVALKRGDGLLPGLLAGKRRVAGGTAPPPELREPSRSGVVFDGVEGGTGGASALGPRSRAVTRRYFTEESSDE